MKQVQIGAFGVPAEVAACVEVPDVGTPGPGELVFDVLAFPINPADMWFCRGSTRPRPPLPATPGAECIGRVVAIGSKVSGVTPGDLVINLQRGNWAQRRRVKAEDVVSLPAGIDLRQGAMMRINPPTALLMLTDIVDLKPGEWLVQNVANSAVGRLVIALAKARGLKTVNVVRREALFADLKALGADQCVVDGPDLGDRVLAATGGARIRLGLDAVSGAATGRVGDCLVDGGTVCCYGSMSGEDPTVPRLSLIYRGITLTGFMLGRFLAKRNLDQVRAIYAELGAQVLAGVLSAPVERVYPIEDIKVALSRADQGERAGKILVAPNGPV